MKALLASWGSAGLVACGGAGGEPVHNGEPGASGNPIHNGEPGGGGGSSSGGSSGGSGGSGGGTAPTITISSIPQITFVGGIPSTHAFAQYVQVPVGYEPPVYALNGALPVGVSFDQNSGLLTYDGSGTGVQVASLSLSVSANPMSNFITSFTLTSAVGGSLLPWTMGHFFRQGDVPSGVSIRADVDDFQAVVRNRWPDGSVKFAVLSGRCNLSAGVARTVQLTQGIASGGVVLTTSDLLAAAPGITVQVGSYGSVALASALASPFKQLLSGPVASEWQYKLPVDAQLTVWLYVRYYKGGRIEFMTSVENGWWDYTGATNKTAQIVVSGGGQTLYDSGSAIDIKHHTRIVCTAGHSGKLWIGGDPSVIPSHNSLYLQRSGAVPAFLATSVSASTLNGLAQTYTPNAQLGLPGNNLGSGGDHPSIGWLPRWDACYVVSTDARAYKSVLVHSFASAAYSYHWRNGSTSLPVAYADFPTTQKGSNSGTNYGGRQFYSNQYGTDWDISHGWLPGYMAYVVTGDWWHLEELQFAVKWVHYTSTTVARGNGTGLMVRSLQARGEAWAWRNCATCAAITPDNDSERAAYVGAMGATVTWLLGYHTNALGILTEPAEASWGDPGGDAPWMSDYGLGSLCWAKDLKVLSGSAATDLDTAIARFGAGLVQRMSDGNNPNGWHWNYQTYRMYLGPAWPYYSPQTLMDANWGITFQRFFGRANGPDLDGGPIKEAISGAWNTWPNKTSFGAGYLEYAMSALAQCANQGVAGASTALNRIKAASNYNSCLSGFTADPRWGLAVRS